jgi:hypothetical protein
MGHRIQITFDAHEPRRLADFWALALGYVPQPPPEGFDTWEDLGRAIGLSEDEFDNYAAVVDPDGAGPRIYFQKVPEGKTAKNRMHLDVSPVEAPPGDWDAVMKHVRRLTEAGATIVAERHDRVGSCMVMQDPEGNEFCVH